ncbi:hypothetical protein [Anaerococcus tetradius]|uniref:hypothetical protein n=1 Tax=Anaerococcus tetradius TaxID=33036 RepID=UPI0023F13413|nr:hypothetical protein [Anaerococcus tetradius]
MKQPNLSLDDYQIKIINHGLALLPDLQDALPDTPNNRKLFSKSHLVPDLIQQLGTHKANNLTKDQTELIALSILGLHLIATGKIFIDQESKDFATANFFKINHLHQFFLNL